MNRHTLRNDCQINAKKQTKILSLNEHETAIEKPSFEVEKSWLIYAKNVAYNLETRFKNYNL
jgi:hypothetical protein